MLTFRFTGAYGEMIVPETLTTGMVGRQVLLMFSPEWEGLSKTVVFSAGSVTKDAVYTGEPVTIPTQVLENPLQTLYVGAYGVSADGTVVIPTVRAKGPEIAPGVDPSGDPGTDPGLEIWAQIQSQIGSLDELDTEEKGNLVAAINDLAISGESGATFTPTVSASGVISWTNDKGLENPAPVSIMGPAGEKGEKGEPGVAGHSPVKGTDYWTEKDQATIIEDTLATMNRETWTFTLEDGSTVNKVVPLL